MSNPLGVSEAASLALHASAILAGAEGRAVATSRIAELLGASEAHLSKVLQRLSRAGLVRGTRGPGGGFTLTRRPKKVALREIYEAIEGPLVVQRCLMGVPVCGRSHCPLGDLFGKLGDEISSELGKINLGDVAVRGAAPNV